jgi:hypothetical protein
MIGTWNSFKDIPYGSKNQFPVLNVSGVTNVLLYWPVHLLSEDMSSREDASTSWPSSSVLRGRRKTYLTILKWAWSDHFKMVVSPCQGTITWQGPRDLRSSLARPYGGLPDLQQWPCSAAPRAHEEVLSIFLYNTLDIKKGPSPQSHSITHTTQSVKISVQF